MYVKLLGKKTTAMNLNDTEKISIIFGCLNSVHEFEEKETLYSPMSANDKIAI